MKDPRESKNDDRFTGMRIQNHPLVGFTYKYEYIYICSSYDLLNGLQFKSSNSKPNMSDNRVARFRPLV